MTMLPNCSGVTSPVRDSTVNSRSRLSMRPDGSSTFWVRSALSMSWTVRLKAASRSRSIQMRMA